MIELSYDKKNTPTINL